MAYSKKDVDVRIKNHNEDVKNKQGTLANRKAYHPDMSRTKFHSKNSNVKIICPKTGDVIEELGPKDKGFFKKPKFNYSGASKAVTFSDHESYEEVMSKEEAGYIIETLTKGKEC